MILLFTNILYILIEFNLFNIIYLVKKNIKVYFKNINKFFLIVINNKIIEYTDIKKDLYYLKIADFFILLLNLKNLYSLLIINQDENSDLEANIKYYFILNLYIKKELGDYEF